MWLTYMQGYKLTKLFMSSSSLAWKILFMFVCLVNKPSLSLSIKQAKLKYNNIFVNKHGQFNYI